ncbi:MAG TPA: HNH endonuclease [Opitutaceae bacterium]|nr:HNH endonuclease [Opitutaceae bacterium]
MGSLPPDTDVAARIRIFRAVVPYFGKVLPASFFQKTSGIVPDVARLHHLIEGIYKPAWSSYPLSIASMLQSRYSDEVHFNPDRTWWIQYSPKTGGMDLAVNAGLIRCMTDRQPLLILRQVSTKTNSEGARHRLLGLGLVESFDPATDLFRIRGLEWGEVAALLGLGLSDDLLETALRLESLEQWVPFVAEDRAIYRVSRQKRDAAFSSIVLDNYGYTCAVTGQRFHSPTHTEADGAHIIGKEACGTDDPRNGIALSKSVHWAFDRGLFTISDQYEVLIHPKARDADAANFPLLAMDRRRIDLPKDSYYWPHLDALAWHQREVFSRFSL